MAKIVYAKGKYIRRSPQKVRLVVDLIRGKNAQEAMDILRFTNKGATEQVAKVLKSAVANATHNEGAKKDQLVVVDAYVDEAPTFKRGKAVSRGRYHQILRRNSHIVIGVATPGAKEEKTVKKDVKTEKKEVAKKEVQKSEKKETKTSTKQKKSSSKESTSKTKSSSKSKK